MTSKTITSRLNDRVQLSISRVRERHDHDRAMSDPRIRDEHFAARARDTSRGHLDCPYCT